MADETTKSIAVDPMNPVERAQVVYEKGPETAVAAFFTIAFFVTLVMLIRTKDKHIAKISELMKEHNDTMSEFQDRERDRAVKLEVTLSNFLDMMEDVRFIAHEMRRVRMSNGAPKKPDTQGGSNGQAS